MKTTKAFWRRAVEENVNYYLGEKVSEIKKSKNIWKVRAGFDTFSSPILINCAGAWGDVIASMMGDYAPLKAEALTMIVTQRLPEFIQPVVGLTSGGLSFKQSPEGTLLIGGSHQGKPNRDLETAEPDPLTLSNSAKIVTRVFPSLTNVNVARAWCGLEGKMPDDIPVIGSSMTQEAGYHAFGFCGHGFQLSPIVGKLLAELIVDGKPSIPLDAFSISRFGGEQNHYIN
jgi:sarcosine oxidase subunit beta